MFVTRGNTQRRIARSIVTILALTLIQTIIPPIITPVISAPIAQAVDANLFPTDLGTVYRYLAESYTSGATTWPEATTGATNQATISNTATKVTNIAGNFGASKAVTAVRGTTGTSLTFPTVVGRGTAADTKYTFFFVARYTATNTCTDRNRIFTSVTGNWLSGFWGCSVGVAYHEGWMTGSSPGATEYGANGSVTGNKWLLGADCGYNSTAGVCSARFRALGSDKTTVTTNTDATAHQVMVNGGAYNELSGFEIAEVISYPKNLTIPEVIRIENYLAAKYGLSLSSGAANKLDIHRSSIGSVLGRSFETQPQIAIEDSNGTIVTSDNSTVITATVTGANGSTIGTVTATAVNGIATFTNFGLNGYAGNSYTITYTANTGYTSTSESRVFTGGFSETDTALSLNGTNQFAYTTTPSQFSATTDFTLEAWVKPTGNNVNNWNLVICKEGIYELGFTSSGGVPYWSYGLSSTTTQYGGVISNVPVIMNEWHHIALTRATGSTQALLYVDGNLAYTGTADKLNATDNSLSQLNTHPFIIGGRRDSSGTNGGYFPGLIDHVMVFNDVRSAEEIKSDMHSYVSTTEPNMIGYFDFNEGSGSAIYNRVQSAVSSGDLTLLNSPAFTDVKTVDTSINPLTIVKFTRTYLTNVGGWKAPAGISRLTALVVAGGGGGGSRHAGGGGAGGVAWAPIYSVGNNAYFKVTVGVGGVGYGQAGNSPYVDGSNNLITYAGSNTSGVGTNGGDSTLLPANAAESITALGGGGGGGTSLAGGSSGGSNSFQYTTVASAAQYSTTYFTGYGNIGGRGYDGTACGSDWCGGGGGGAGAVGGSPTTSGTTQAGNGGAGRGFIIDSSTTTYFGGGGGGGSYTAAIASTGGIGGGGAGGKADQGVKGSYSTGGGGGGGGFSGQTSYRGGNGGSGIIIIRWITAPKPTFTNPVNAYLNVGMTETFTTNVSADSATAGLTRTFKWESTTAGIGGTYSQIKQGTGASNAYFSWVPPDTTTSGSNYLYRVVVTDSDVNGLFILETSTSVYAVINRALVVSGTSGIAKTINVSKSETFTITLGTSTYRPVLTSNNPGITLDTSTAGYAIVKIADTMTVGTYYETLTVTDSVSATVVTPLTIRVKAPPSLSNGGELVDSATILNLDASNSNSYPMTGNTWSDLSGRKITSVLNPSYGATSTYMDGSTRASNWNNGLNCTAPTFNKSNMGYFDFNGTNQCASVQSVKTQTTYSYHVWLKRSGNQSAQSSVISNLYQNTYDQINIALYWSGSNTLVAGIFNGGSWFTTSALTVADETWTFVSVTFDGSNLKMYANDDTGTAYTTAVTPFTFTPSLNSPDLILGRKWAEAYFFKGSIGSIRLYNRVISTSEITQNYNATKSRFDAGYLTQLTPTKKYGTALTDTFTVTSGGDTKTVVFSAAQKAGVKWDTSTASSIILNLQESLTATTHYDTITVTDNLGATTVLPLSFVVAKADTLTISMDTPTVVTYNGSPITVYPRVYYKGLAGVDTLTVTTRFSSTSYTDTSTVPTNADTYTVVAASPIFSIGAASNYVAVLYETSTARINQAKQQPLMVNYYGARAGSPFTLQVTGGSGPGAVTETITAGSSATNCAVSNHVLSNSNLATEQKYCSIVITKAASTNFFVETMSANIYFMVMENNMPSNQVGSGPTIGLNGNTSFETSTASVPTITSLGGTTFMTTTTMTITGTGFSSGPITVKFWRNKFGTSINVFSNTLLTVVIPSDATSGPVILYNANGFVATSSVTITPFINM